MPNFRVKHSGSRKPLRSFQSYFNSRSTLASSTTTSVRKLHQQNTSHRTFPLKKLLLIAIFACVVVAGWKLVKALTPSDWDTHHRLNMIIYSGDQAFFLTLGGDQRELVWQSLPTQAVVANPQPTTEAMAVSKLQWAYQLGIIPDYFLTIPSSSEITTKTQLLSILASQFIQPSADNFQIWIRDRVKIWWYIFSLRPGQAQFSPIQSAESKTVSEFSSVIQSYLLDIVIKQRGTSVAVINTTEVSGLAAQTSQILTQIGYSVVRVDSEMQGEEVSKVFSLSTTPPNVAELKQLLLFTPTHTHQVQPDASVFQRYRSDILLVLGKDFGEWYEQNVKRVEE